MVNKAAARPSLEISPPQDRQPQNEQRSETMDVGQLAQETSETPNGMLRRFPYHTSEIVKPRSELGPIQEMPRPRRPMIIPPFDPNEISEHPVRPVFEKWQIPSHHHAALDKYIKGKFDNSDIVPPKNTLFHEALGNYVQRWAIWISEIEDRDRRDHLLVWVMEKMEKIWRYGIDRGLYPRRGDPQLDEEGHLREHGAPTGLREKPGKRGKKNDDTLILEDEILPRQIEKAKTPVRITREEFIAAGGNIDSLNTRIALRDVQGGEALFQAEAERLGRKFHIADWSYVKDVPKSSGRVLWMYCLHEVQMAKEEVEKLMRIMKNMTATNQKKNTNRRIADEMNRVNHWLAMALELHPKWVEAQQQINTDDEDQVPREEHFTHTAKNPHTLLTDQADDDVVVSTEQQELAEASKPVAVAEQPGDALAPWFATTNQASVIDPNDSVRQQDITTPATAPLSILVGNLDITKSRKSRGQATDETAINTALNKPYVESEAIGLMDVDSQNPQRRKAETPRNKPSAFDEVPRTAQRTVVLKLINSGKNKQSKSAKRRKREKESDEEWQDEAKVMNPKKQKVSNWQEQQIQTTKQDKVSLTSHQTAAASPSATSSLGAQAKHDLPNLSEEDRAKRHSYLLKVFIPKINQILGASGSDHLRIFPRSWDVIGDKLAAASVPVEIRNQLMSDFYSGFREEQQGDATRQATSKLATKDDSGTRDSLQPANQDYQKTSVEQPITEPTLSKVVTIKTLRNFDPAVYSSNNVSKASDFRYRFTPQSSLHERRACEAFIMEHVSKGTLQRMPGKYQPFHVEREQGQDDLICQGYWDEIDGMVAKDGHWLLGGEHGLASDHGMQEQGGDPKEPEEHHMNDEDPLGLLD